MDNLEILSAFLKYISHPLEFEIMDEQDYHNFTTYLNDKLCNIIYDITQNSTLSKYSKIDFEVICFKTSNNLFQNYWYNYHDNESPHNCLSGDSSKLCWNATKILYISNTKEYPFCSPCIKKLTQSKICESLLICPLKFKDTLIGYYSLGSDQESGFDILYNSGAIYTITDLFEKAIFDIIIEYQDKHNDFKQIYTNEKYQTYRHFVFDNISDSLVIFDANGIIYDCNTSFEKLLKLKKEDIINTRLRKYISNKYPFIGEKILNCANNGLCENLIVEILDNENNTFICEIKLSQIKSVHNEDKEHVIAVIRDITEEHKISTNQKNKIKLLIDALDESLDAVSIVEIKDPSSIIIHANKSYCKIFEYSLEELTGMEVCNLTKNKPYTDTQYSVKNGLRNGIPHTGEFTCYSKTNKEIKFYCSLTPIKNDFGVYDHYIAIERILETNE